MQKPGEIETKVALDRLIIGRCFAFLVNLFAIGGIVDTQCGFKMFRREAALAIFSRQKTTGFAFAVEILFIARRLSLSIAEVPVNWVAQPGSKVNLVTDSIKMLWDVCRIRWSHRNFEVSFSLAQQRSHARSQRSIFSNALKSRSKWRSAQWARSHRRSYYTSQQARHSKEIRVDPLVTFVVPCYNLAHLLPECLNSILVQTYPDFEVLVMDNCSPDDTPGVVRSFHDPRLKHVRNQTNIGHVRNFNKGIAIARGKYVWLVSADDFLISPHALGRYVDVMERNPQVGYVFSCATTAQDANHTREVPSWAYAGKTDRIWKGRTLLKRLIRNSCIIMSSVMARKECYEKIGMFSLDMPYANDWYLWSSLALRYDVAYFSEPMVCCRVHGESLTAAFNRGNDHVCIADEINVLCSIARQAELAGLPSLRRACNASIASHAVQEMKSSAAGYATPGLSESDVEALLQHKTRDAKDEKDLRARLSVAIGDAAFWRGDRTKAIQSYSASLKLRPWWVKSWAKYLLLRSGSVGVGARRLLTLACAVTGLRTYPGRP